MQRKSQPTTRELILVFAGIFFFAQSASAASVSEIKDRIADTNSQIAEINQEIKQYEEDLAETRAKRNTLENKVSQIDLTRRKLSSEIRVTEGHLESLGYDINLIDQEISRHQSKINTSKESIAETIRHLYKEDQLTFVELVLAEDSLSTIFDRSHTIIQMQAGVSDHVSNLQASKLALEQNQIELERNRGEVAGLKDELADRKYIADQERRAQNNLLSETKSEESSYQKLLDEKIAARNRFEAELLDAEAQLKMTLDQSALPSPGTEVLSWPVRNVIITQYFGNTAFSRRNSQVYNGKGHTGIDIGVSTGTKIFAAAGGTVTHTGNTDNGCPGGSYGKWALVRHNNGLSTLYAHLSLIKASPGQVVERGELIAYSGNTGYSTGPHLHFTVYASQGVRVDKLTRANGTVSSCGVMPISPRNGYLNPLVYLPEE